MIDADSINYTFAKPIEDAPMCRIENVWPFNAQGNQIVDVEESAIAKLLVGSTPVSQSVVLQVQQLIQSVMIRIQLANGIVDRQQRFRMFFTESLQ